MTRLLGHRADYAGCCDPIRGTRSSPRKVRMGYIRASSGTSPSLQDAPRYSVLLECDGVLCDLHLQGHMEAFNRAFAELGYDCVRWMPPTYHDLLRTGDGTGVGMISSYFSQVGWPLMLPTSDRKSFAENVYTLKRQKFRELVQSGSLPLRKGVSDLIRDILTNGAALGLIAETNSTAEDAVVDALLAALGNELALGIRVFPTGGSNDSESSEDEGADGTMDLSNIEVLGTGLTLEQAMQQAQAKAKVRDAEVFARATRSNSGALGMGVSPSLLAGHSKAQSSLLSAGYITAANLTMGTSARACAVLAASSRVMEAAKAAGALSVAVPPSLSARGKFAAADVSFDGFGPGGGAAWPRIKNMLAKRVEAAGKDTFPKVLHPEA